MRGLAALALVVAAFGMGYFLSYFLRNVNAVLAPDIVSAFDLTATQIGLLTSVYFMMAAIVLVPVAILLDRFGPRRLLVWQMLVAAAGCALFAAGGSPEALIAGRALIGLGVAGCLTTAFKAVTLWFPRERWATGNSLVLGVGSLGVICGTQPLQWMLQHAHWREVFWMSAALAVGIALAAALAVPERDGGAASAQSGGVYRRVLALPVFWRLMPVASLSMAVFFAIQGLWANAWMSDVAGLSQADIGRRLLLMALAMSFGMLVNGTLADFVTQAGAPLALVMALGIAGLLTAQLALVAEWAPRAWWPWAVMGYAGNIGALGYPLISRRFPTSASARAMSVLAMSNFALAFAAQFLFGWMLDFWGQEAGGYPADAYRAVLGLFLGIQALAFVWFLSSREVWTNPQPAEASQ